MRHRDDYYVTPAWAIEQFLDEWLKLDCFALGGEICDPCAGGCAKYGMPYPAVVEARKGSRWSVTTNDIRDDSPALHHRDFLDKDFRPRARLYISNPPFSLAQQFIDKALGLAHYQKNGRLAFLVRMTLLGSQGRWAWWQTRMPRYAFIHSRRIGFIPDRPNRTDSAEYAHLVWYAEDYKSKSPGRDFTELRVI